MTNKKLHINKEDFNRYLEDKMTNTERNAFEKELQKHPFETEALEGSNTILPEDLKNDLNEINAKIKPRKLKSSYRYWAVAASVLLVVSAGIIWIQVKDQNMISEMAETKTVENQKKLHQKLDIIAEPSHLENEEIETTNTEVISPIEDIKETAEIAETTVIENEPHQKSAAKKRVMIRGVSQQPEPNEKIITADDKLDTGKSGIINDNNSFAHQEKKVKSNQVEDYQMLYDAPISSVVETPVAAPPPPKEIVDSKALPNGGFDNFDTYLDSTVLLPENYNKKKAVVKIEFKIDSRGVILDFRNKNDSDTLLFSKAKEILLNGPKWSPEIKNGKRLDSTVKLKIIFRK